MFKNSGLTSRQYNLVHLLMQVIAVYSENHKKHIMHCADKMLC
jgi:hypothetical protein